MLWWSMSNCISFLPKPPVFILRVTILEKVSACIWIDMIESYIYMSFYVFTQFVLVCFKAVCQTSYRAIFRMACAWGQDDSRDNSGAAQIRYRSLQRWHGNYLVTLVEFPRHLFHIDGAFKRKVQASLAPYLACFRAVDVASSRPGASGEIFYIANMKALLRFVASQCPSLQDVFRAHSAEPLSAILAHDECTSGNVLNPLMRQKTLLFYVSFTCLKPILKSSRAWFPVAAVPHDQLEHCVGGMSAVTATFIQHWTEDALHVPFYICDGLHVSLQLRIFVSDLDSQRGAFAAKGSAGLKPCIFCGNCLMGNAEGAARNEHFRTIAEHDITFFQKNDRSDLEATIKYWIGLLPRMSKQEISLRERCLGFNLDPHSLWNYPPAVLDAFNIDTIMNDAMHCYFATGICNSEIILLLQAAKDHMGATVQDLCEACLVARWKRHDVKESQAWLKRLWKPAFFGSDMYKGSGSQTEALMHLLRWIAESVWMAIPSMQPYCLCFRALCKCVDALNVCDDTNDWQQLKVAQAEHQKLFAALYPENVRPKHHHRLHLPEQYAKLGCQVMCWGVESSHRDYKSTFASNLRHLLLEDDCTGRFGKSLMPRMLLRSIELFNVRPFLEKGFELHDPFTEDEVYQATGIKHARLSSKCIFPMVDARAGDFLVWGSDFRHGGIVNFFLVKDARLYFVSDVQADMQQSWATNLSERERARFFAAHGVVRLGTASMVGKKWRNHCMLALTVSFCHSRRKTTTFHPKKSPKDESMQIWKKTASKKLWKL